MKKIAVVMMILVMFASIPSGHIRNFDFEIIQLIEKIVLLDAELEKQQHKMVLVEKEEKELFDQLVIQDTNDVQKIQSLVKNTIESAQKREELIESEEKIIQQSMQTLETVSFFLEKIKETSLKKEINNVIVYVQERNQIHEQLVEVYKGSIQEDITLYSLWNNESVTISQLEKQIDFVNDSYEKVEVANMNYNIAKLELEKVRNQFFLAKQYYSIK